MKHVNTEIGFSTEKYVICMDGHIMSGKGEYNSLENAEADLPKKSKHIFQILRLKTDTLIFNYVNESKK